MTTPELSPLLRDLLYAQQHRLLDDDLGRACQRIIKADVADPFVVGEIQGRVSRHQIEQAFRGPFPLPQLRTGDLVLGLDERGEQVRIPVQWLNAHCLTVAGSGAGKTTRALFHVLQVALLGVVPWLFDCRKREFAKLVPLLARAGIELIVLPIRALCLNPLQVPLGVAPEDWLARISDMLVGVLGLPPRATKMLQSLIHRLFEHWRVLSGGGTLYPTLFDLLEAARRDRDGNAPARQALIDSLDPLLRTLGPEVLAYRQGWAVHDLARLPINFVLGGVPDAAQNLMLSTLVLAECTSRIARGISNMRMDLLIAVDEGQRLVTTATGHVAGMAELLPLVRGTGIGLDLSVPTGHGLLPEVLSCTATKYLGRSGSAADYELIGRAMGLSRQQLDHASHNLRPGRFITQVGEGSWRHPYLLDIPPMRTVETPPSHAAMPQALRRLPVVAASLPGAGDQR